LHEVWRLVYPQTHPVDHELLRGSNGRFTIFGPIGAPLLLLTTRSVGQQFDGPCGGGLSEVASEQEQVDRLFSQ